MSADPRRAAPHARLDGRARDAWLELFGPHIAHRGLWSLDSAGRGKTPENSLAAFKAAGAADYGVELDVRLSSDGEAMVIHDAELQRMTGVPGRVAERTAAELGALRLDGTSEPVPTLSQALKAVNPDTLTLIELKTLPGAEGPLEARVAEVLDGFRGLFAVIGFNAASLVRMAALRPGWLLGLDSYAWDSPDLPLSAEVRRGLAEFDHLPASRAHFILPGLDILPSAAVEDLRDGGVPVVAWTTRSPEQHESAEPYADNLIFEGFRP